MTDQRNQRTLTLDAMPQYKSHKIVRALKIRHVDRALGGAVITPEDELYAAFVVDEDYVSKHDPKPGGYFVAYADGYRSWSPAETFESGYTRIEEIEAES